MQELGPRFGYSIFAPLIDELNSDEIPREGKMQVALGLLKAQQLADAITWATKAQTPGLLCSLEDLHRANFQDSRQYHECDLQPFINAAQQMGDSNNAARLADLQMWWEPSWAHLQALESALPPQRVLMRRQQLQSLVLNDKSCKPHYSFEVLVRENKVQLAANIIFSVVKDDPGSALASLKAGLELLGWDLVRSSGIMDHLWNWLADQIKVRADVDVVMEWLCPHFPQEVLQLYNQRMDAIQQELLDANHSNPSQALQVCVCLPMSV